MRNFFVFIVIAVNAAVVNLIAILANVFDCMGMGWIAAGFLFVVSVAVAATTSRCRSAICRVVFGICIFAVSLLLSILVFEMFVRGHNRAAGY